MPLPAKQALPFIATVLTVIALLTGMLWVDDHQVRAARSASMPIALPDSTQSRTLATQAAAGETPTRLPDPVFAASLEGTEIDGQLRADANGQLLIDLSVRDFFDYFLNTVGEVPAERMLAEVHQLIDQSLPATAASEAKALLARYIDYRHQLASLENLALDPRRRHDPGYQLEMLSQGLDAVKALRQRSFDDTVRNAFFALEEAYADYTLASLQVQQRQDLSATEQHELIRWHRQQLPPLLQESEQRQLQQIAEHRSRQQLIDNAPSAQAAARALQEQGVPEQQVQDVASWLTERESFEQHFAEYQQALTALEQSGLNDSDREQQREQLRAAHFADEAQQTWARLRELDMPH